MGEQPADRLQARQASARPRGMARALRVPPPSTRAHDPAPQPLLCSGSSRPRRAAASSSSFVRTCGTPCSAASSRSRHHHHRRARRARRAPDACCPGVPHLFQSAPPTPHRAHAHGAAGQEAHGHTQVPATHTDQALARWVAQQRLRWRRGALPAVQRARLECVGFTCAPARALGRGAGAAARVGAAEHGQAQEGAAQRLGEQLRGAAAVQAAHGAVPRSLDRGASCRAARGRMQPRARAVGAEAT
jgi:hypothetical protein